MKFIIKIVMYFQVIHYFLYVLFPSLFPNTVSRNIHRYYLKDPSHQMYSVSFTLRGFTLVYWQADE